jgi:hypothetical protein
MEENPASVDRSLLIPLAIGAFAIVGICFVLLALRLGAASGNVPMTATATPVKYLYLGTEPVVVQPTDLPTPTEVLAITSTPSAAALPPELLSPTARSTIIVLPGAATNTFVATRSTSNSASATATITATISTAEPSTTFDDVDSVIGYTGNWVGQSGLANTYKNTLHISNTIGDAIQFTFYGERFQFIYQAGPTLGAVQIIVDEVPFILNQVANETGSGEWDSANLAAAYHTVTLTHISGGSINIDALVLFTLSTPTPTITPTITRTVSP